jgi:ribosomal protein S18 acetylase RimI-like enzyme
MPSLDDDILIKSLTAHDVPKVRELHVSHISVSMLLSHSSSAIHQSMVLPVNYPSSFFTQLLVLPAHTCFVAYKQGQPNVPIAFISAVTRQPALRHSDSAMNLSPDSQRIFDLTKPFLEILTLGVLPAYQHCGLARRLLKCVIDNFHPRSAGPESSLAASGTLVSATVSISNTSALKFYESMGMSISSDVIRNLYRTISHGSRDAYLVAGTL